MKTRKSHFYIAVFTALAIAWNSASLRAADPPVAVISINNTGQLLSDVEYLMQATGTAAFGQFFMPQIKAYLQGIDSKKPIGIVLSLDGMEPKPLAFVPVTDLEAVLSTVEDQLGEAEDAGNGVYQLQGPQPVFVKESGGWAFVAMDAAALNDTPANPAALLKGLNKKYDIAVRGFVQNIPKPLRDMAMTKMGEAMDQGIQGADDAQRAMAEAQIKQMKVMVEQGEELTIGWSIDSANKNVFFDFSVSAKAGTELAEQLNTVKSAKSKYSGFVVPNAAVTANMTSVVEKSQIEQTITMLAGVEESALEEIENDASIEEDSIREGAKKLVSGVFDIFRDTLQTGKLDAGMSVILDEKSMTMALAGHVADGAKVEDLVKELIELAKDDEDVSFSKMNLNSGTHGDVRLHELAVPIPEDEYIGQVLDGELEICLGAAENDIYLALGVDPVNKLKKMIDKSKSAGGTETQPFSMVVKLAPILRFAEAMEDQAMLGAIAESLEQNGNDHLRFNVSGIEDGVTYRFLIEEGILKTLGQVGQMRAAGGGF